MASNTIIKINKIFWAFKQRRSSAFKCSTCTTTNFFHRPMVDHIGLLVGSHPWPSVMSALGSDKRFRSWSIPHDIRHYQKPALYQSNRASLFSVFFVRYDSAVDCHGFACTRVRILIYMNKKMKQKETSVS